MNSHNAITIDASHNGEKLVFGLRHHQAAIWNYEDLIVSMSDIENSCHEMINEINISSRSGKQAELMKTLKTKGRQLCDTLIPTHFKELLRNTKEDHLLLSIDEHLVHIPWELLCVDEQFLCEKFSMGRSVKIKPKIPHTCERNINKPIRLWIVCPPNKDLTKTGWEGNEICRQVDAINKKQGTTILAYLDIEKTPQDLKRDIKEYDFIHYVGHGDYDLHTPGKSGWPLIDSRFTADDIDAIAGGSPMPAMVFSNACQSTRTEKWHKQNQMNQDSFGLANSFLRSGVEHFIGPFWEIPDEPASQFSIWVYHFMSQGKTIGQSIKLARKTMKQKNPYDASFASYVLYGDPRRQYFNTIDKPGTPLDTTKQTEKSVIRSNQQSSSTNVNTTHYGAFPNRFWLLIVLVVFLSVFGKYLFYSHKQTDDFLSPEQIYAFMKLEKEKDDEIDRLIHEINSKMNEQNLEFETVSKDQWTSKPLRISIVVCDSLRSFMNQGLDDMVASAVENELLDFPRVRVLDRTELETIIREYRLILSQLVDSKQRIKPTLLPVDLFLDIRVRVLYSENRKSYIIVKRLKKTRTSEIIFKQEIPIDINDFVYYQQIGSNLIEFIQKQFPIRAKVDNYTNQYVSLNIGFDMGVRSQMNFCTDKPSDIVIQINEVFKEKSNGILSAGKILPEIDTKMVQCNPKL